MATEKINLSKFTESEKVKIAASPITPEDVLIELAQEESDKIKKTVASNDYAPLKAYELLYKDSNDNIRLAIAAHPNLSEDIYLSLAQDSVKDIRMTIAQNKSSSENVIKLFENEQDTRIRNIAMEHKNAGKDLEVFKIEEIESLAAPLDLLIEAAKSSIEDIKIAAAGNIFTPEDSLRLLYRTGSKEVKHKLIENPSTPDSMLIRLIPEDHFFFYLRDNKNVSAQVLEEAYNYFKNTDKSELVNLTQHSNTSEHILRQLSSSREKYVKLGIIGHSSCTEDLLLKFAKQKNEDILIEVARHAKTEAVFEAIYNNEKFRITDFRTLRFNDNIGRVFFSNSNLPAIYFNVDNKNEEYLLNNPNAPEDYVYRVCESIDFENFRSSWYEDKNAIETLVKYDNVPEAFLEKLCTEKFKNSNGNWIKKDKLSYQIEKLIYDLVNNPKTPKDFIDFYGEVENKKAKNNDKFNFDLLLENEGDLSYHFLVEDFSKDQIEKTVKTYGSEENFFLSLFNMLIDLVNNNSSALSIYKFNFSEYKVKLITDFISSWSSDKKYRAMEILLIFNALPEEIYFDYVKTIFKNTNCLVNIYEPNFRNRNRGLVINKFLLDSLVSNIDILPKDILIYLLGSEECKYWVKHLELETITKIRALSEIDH